MIASLQFVFLVNGFAGLLQTQKEHPRRLTFGDLFRLLAVSRGSLGAKQFIRRSVLLSPLIRLDKLLLGYAKSAISLFISLHVRWGRYKQEDEKEPVVSRVLFVTTLDAFVAKVARNHLSSS